MQLPTSPAPRFTLHALALLALAVLATATPASARPAKAAQTQAFDARVVGVVDGDTVDVLDSAKRQTRCRVGNIDAPERSQAFGQASRKHLSGLVFGKQVLVQVTDKDRYGRSICDLEVSGQDVATAQVAAGMAWVYTAYNRNRALPAVEGVARRAGAGLWAHPSPTAPWEWRRK